MSQRVSATDLIHEKLRQAIVSGELLGGSLHSIYQVAARFGVSRTPVRDAVLRLADAGMVDIERNRGFRVRGLRVVDIRHVFELRLLLEVPAAAFAARRPSEQLLRELTDLLDALAEAAAAADSARFVQSDRQLHRAIISSTGNDQLVAAVESLRDATQARGLSTMQQSRNLHEIQHEHIPIVEAIRHGDALAASRMMRSHLVETGMLLMRQVASTTGETIHTPWPNDLIP